MTTSAEPEVVTLARQMRAKLISLDAATASEMIDAYGKVWLRVKAEVDGLLLEAAHNKLTAGKVQRLGQMRKITRMVSDELDHFAGIAGTRITEAQAQAVNLARENTRRMIDAALPPGIDTALLEGTAVQWTALHREAFSLFVGMAGNGGPLARLLDAIGPDVAAGVREAITSGIAQGWSPRFTATVVRQKVGMGLTRALTISRTETLRSYREANRLQYAANSHLVKGFRRVSARDDRVCMACFVDWKVPILTSNGFKSIGRIKPGDLVLTHKGRFRKVLHVFKQAVAETRIVTIEALLSGGAQYNSLTLTEDHPILTRRGWIKAGDLNESDQIAVPTKPCNICGKPMPLRYCGTKRKEPKVCSPTCSGKAASKGLHSNSEAHQRAVRNMTWTHWGMLAKGMHPFQRADVREKAARNSLRSNSLLISSKTEGVLGHALDLLGLRYETQYPIFSHHNKKQNRQYNYYVDFAFPIEKVVVEADGEPWHSWDAKRIEHDRIRQERIEQQGWTVLRYTGNQIHADSGAIAAEVQAILRNHDGAYGITWVSIRSIHHGLRRPPSSQFRVIRWNLEVEEDNSFVAKFAVVHNCAVLDGTFYETTESGYYHPQDRCTLAPVTVTYGELGIPVEDPPDKTTTTQDWFLNQDETTQRAMLGDEKYGAWRGGKFELSDIPKRVHSDVWGDSFVEKTLEELLR